MDTVKLDSNSLIFLVIIVFLLATIIILLLIATSTGLFGRYRLPPPSGLTNPYTNPVENGM